MVEHIYIDTDFAILHGDYLGVDIAEQVNGPVNIGTHPVVQTANNAFMYAFYEELNRRYTKEWIIDNVRFSNNRVHYKFIQVMSLWL